MLRLSVILTIAIALTQSVRSEEEDKDSKVIVLTKTNFEENLKNNQYILVEFYAPWCGHCKALEPEYKSAAATLDEEGSEIKLGTVDATQETELAESHGVRGYPTIKFFKNGKAVEYTGGRTASEIVQWLKKKTGPPAVTLKTADEAKKAKEAAEVSVFAFYKDVTSDDAKKFLEAADGIELPLYITSEQEVYDALEVKSDGIVLFKNFDELRNDFEGEVTAEAVANFVSSNSLPLIIDFNQDSAQKIFGGEIKSHHLLFAGKKSDEYKEIEKYYKVIAKEFRGKILCVVIDTDEEEHDRIMEFFGIKKDEVPTNRIIQLQEDMAKFKADTKEINEENLRKFIGDVLDGKLKQHLLSQDLPEDWDKNPVKVLVSSNFDDVAFDKTKDVLVEFYAPWCGHCKQLEPIYNDLGKKFEDKKDIVIAKMDATVNELEHTKVQSFPTIKLYKKESNEAIEYNGERTLEGLGKFLETNGEYGQAAPEEEEPEEEEEDKAQKDKKDEL